MRLGDVDLTRASEREFRKLRGKRIAMVLQDPKYSLDPVMSVGKQIAETHRHHFGSTAKVARDRKFTIAPSMIRAMVSQRMPMKRRMQSPRCPAGPGVLLIQTAAAG